MRILLAMWLMAVWTGHAAAADILVDGVRLRGSAEDVALYDLARATHRLAAVRAGAATIDNREQLFAAVKETRDAMLDAELKLTVDYSYPGLWTTADADMRTQLRVEQVRLRERLQHLRTHLTEAEYVAHLFSMRHQMIWHPGRDELIRALGQLDDHTTDQILARLAARTDGDRLGDDIWDLARQQRLQELAFTYEARGDYAAAARTLEKWVVREPCGTGAMASRTRRQFEIWRLRAKVDDLRLVRQDMWPVLIENYFYTTQATDEIVISGILQVYGPQDAEALRRDVDAARLSIQAQLESESDDSWPRQLLTRQESILTGLLTHHARL